MKNRILIILASLLVAVNVCADNDRRYIDEVVVTGSNNAVGRDLLPYTVTIVPASQTNQMA